MRLSAWIALPVVLLMLAACAGKPVVEQDATLRSLDGQKARLKPVELPVIKRPDVQRSYETLFETTDNPEFKAIALQRMADLGLESVSARFELGLTEQGAAAGRTEVESELNEVIRRYQSLLELYPNYPGNERVLYHLAWAHDLNGDQEQTLATLTRYLQRYPDKSNRDEIQFRRGELLFGLREYAQAELAYEDVTQAGTEGDFYERALFKHGWAVFKQGDMQRGLNSFFAVLDRNFSHGRDMAQFSRSDVELLEDTLRIISISFAYLDDSESIGEFFQRYGARSYEYAVYEHLSYLYLSQKRIQDAASTYLEFVERYPLHNKSPLFMARVMTIYQQGRLSKELLEAKARFVTEYGLDTPFWQSQDDQVLAEVSESLRSNLQDLSSFYHAQAQKSSKPEDYRAAVQWYQKYVQWFPGDAQTPHMNFLLAESLLGGGDAQAAALAFEQVAYQYPQHGESAEAAYAALLAYQQQVGSLQGSEQLQKRLEVLASSRRFVSFFANDRRVVDVMSTIAEEQMDLKNYNEAVGMANKLVDRKPKPPQRLLVINWNIVAQGNFALENYADAEAATLKLLDLLPSDDNASAAHIERLATAIYRQAEAAQQREDYRAAAQHFLRVGRLAPDSAIRINAEFDAATAYYTNQDWELAIPVLQAFVESYPQHELRQGAEEKLALLYEKQGDWLKTAGAYEELYKNEKDKNKKRLMLWQIAEYYAKANRSVEAVNTYKRYVKAYPQPFAEAMEARFRLAELYSASNKMGERHWWLGQIIKVDKKGPSTERSHYLAAMASLELAQVKLEAYSKVSLVLPLKKNLNKKKKLMQESIKAYTGAAAYALESVTTESTYRIAEIYRAFSRSLFDSERPKGLSSDELEQYDILLEEQAYPFEEKAIEVHEVNTQRTVAGIYDIWVRKSFDALASLSPVRFAKTEKSELVNEKIQ